MDQLEVKEQFLRVLEHPEDVEVKDKLVHAFRKNPDVVLQAVHSAGNETGRLPRAPPSSRLAAGVNIWENCIHQQKCMPKKLFHPRSLEDLVNVVRKGREEKVPVRAAGSGHSFSDITNTEGAFLVDPHGTLASVLDLNGLTLKDDANPATLFRVQSGITVADLNLALDEKNLGLLNMGAYDGQTVSGAVSTGTPGSGIAYGPMASFLQSIVLVSESGTVYQIEPTNGITDPTKFKGKLPESTVSVTLKQDDDWFHAAQVAMGCLGLIYSYTLRVTKAFSLEENRLPTTWEAVRPLLVPSAWNPLPELLAKIDHYELMVNPYAEDDRTHTSIKVERKRIDKTQPRGARHDCFGQLTEMGAVMASPAVALFLNVVPEASPCMIDKALGFLKVYNPPYVDISHKVFTLGIENTMPALAPELHFDAVDCVATIDNLLQIFQDLRSEESWYLAGPIGIRFTAASDSLIAPESGRLTCTAELDMLANITTGPKLLAEVKKRLCGSGIPRGNRSVRIHWGLDLDFITPEDVRNWYPNFAKWQAVYKELNPNGMFDNKFTKRIKLRE